MYETYISRFLTYLELQKLVLEEPGLNAHKISPEAHEDIRSRINELAKAVESLSGIDDKTLLQIKELQEILNNDDGVLAQISSKVSKEDIVNNLNSIDPNKVLSASQGRALNNKITALSTSKLDATALDNAILNALAAAKNSGEFNGENGTSVYVERVDETPEDGANNTVYFSDGKFLRVKNGKTGIGIKNITITEVTSGE